MSRNVIELKAELKKKEFEISNQIVLINDLQNQLSALQSEIKQQHSITSNYQTESATICQENNQILNNIESARKLLASDQKIYAERMKNKNILEKKQKKYQQFLVELRSNIKTYKSETKKTNKNIQKYNVETQQLIDEIRLLQMENNELDRKYNLVTEIETEKSKITSKMDLIDKKQIETYNIIEALSKKSMEKEYEKQQYESTLIDLQNQELELRALIEQQHQQYINDV
ncbi:hypothetical protein TVAG_191420 [Trichomonas vaginalis G3]|uniref:Uncharacterized protein n=1 Tax=Trichomonas vaginalis (strain ATCC PRA-98 / G3) TaxID=412133 RepID=A2EQJ8_TRIV3|nr:hypothetical protein TVAGG3_0976390 [Trichomonas vaginalis G3]EAY05045.1 hypothetical protein TVAG_191420 [Trichomonas vaginalis G3]KAI5488962.1 hypothetical protein TVAGG3_0976390 [Trichomonas vaginalis G3]|eukprot:XP_001317268.1 hypothetical protein [Trichomonas vaginalis G3]